MRRTRNLLAAALSVVAMCSFAVESCGATARKPVAAPADISANYFLSHYVDGSGRVIRYDQGSTTVSEGQAYAMLLAVAVGNRQKFDQVWSWTQHHLRRPDGLFSYLWANGKVTGRDPASDADLDTARALAAAARRFNHPAYARQARALGRDILRKETVTAGGRRLLVAGPWGRAAPYTVDPSYFSPNAYNALARLGRRRAWRQLAQSSYKVLKQSRGGNPPLPPDWAKVKPDGAAYASAAPHGASGGAAPMRYGPDATRVLVRMAESCDPRAHRLAAAAWPFLRKATAGGHDPAFAYDLSGRPMTSNTNAVTLVAAAGAATAAGNHKAAASLLGRAQAFDGAHPSYYGDAWVALGRVMLQTHLLGSCP
ncbi:MAG TPA: glycosyl hydrolase family 8 [Thermoleophilaceae bacterium]|nr:glycosyl hydrolase family 8 [Thermoleophilaceae bacterium]